MNATVDLARMEERVKTFQEATDVNASQDSWASNVKLVGNLHPNYFMFVFCESFLLVVLCLNLFSCYILPEESMIIIDDNHERGS